MPVGALNSRRLSDRSMSLHQTVDTNSPSNERADEAAFFLLPFLNPNVTRTRVARIEIGRRERTPRAPIDINIPLFQRERLASGEFELPLSSFVRAKPFANFYPVYRAGTQACLKRKMPPISVAFAS